MRNYRKRIIHCTLLLLSGFLLMLSPTAHANYFTDFYNGVEQFSELPSEVNKLKESYQQTLSELAEARASIKNYQLQQESLMDQNRQLTETITLLQDAESSKQSRMDQIKVVVIWAVALLIGYFILIRTLRFLMQRSNKR
ncbi:putative PurR-regulated permease PerM [Paenibacillus sp. DS2015]|uniref:hypothetical protein n=1 Tax=Paenibacillus sp. DS2015 TaxID=3373917 RepID=UPI003D1D2B58